VSKQDVELQESNDQFKRADNMPVEKFKWETKLNWWLQIEENIRELGVQQNRRKEVGQKRQKTRIKT